MKINQKGFGVIEILLSIIALTLVVGVGYYVYDQSQDEQTSQQTTNSTSSTVENKQNEQSISTKKEETTESVPDLIEYAEPVKIIQKSESKNLKNASQSFKTMIEGMVAEKPTYTDGCDMPDYVLVNKIVKDEFALGGIGSCGGARIVWVKIDGQWQKADGLGGQAEPSCKDVIKYKVPASIIERCHDSTAKDADEFELIDNPN
jgi:hypothetical protein